MFRIIAKSLKIGILTEREPFNARSPFGFPVIDFARCTACDECVAVCPTTALEAAHPSPDRKTADRSG